jgi:hypothetical protein
MDESICSSFTSDGADKQVSGGRNESSEDDGKSGKVGASVIFTAGMVILVAKIDDRIHDLGLNF